MAAHASLKKEFTVDKKYHILMTWLKWKKERLTNTQDGIKYNTTQGESQENLEKKQANGQSMTMIVNYNSGGPQFPCLARKQNPWIGTICSWAASSEFVSSSIPLWQILTAHAKPFRGARDLAFCLKVPLDSLLVWASSGGSGETARMRRLAWTVTARIADKYQIRLTRPSWCFCL